MERRLGKRGRTGERKEDRAGNAKTTKSAQTLTCNIKIEILAAI